ncbi:efflux RND transporter periplasmic adaptor subunit [Hydrogenophilus thermoluteolus]|nr:efflux RND transporter periplasmic adaptor subunit [Hydrogenophilus thermoluteolus]MBW7657281.1 efflux RND transporter periplasmic adaptor subunit [Hydrogenophilus thermoluteolus]
MSIGKKRGAAQGEGVPDALRASSRPMSSLLRCVVWVFAAASVWGPLGNAAQAAQEASKPTAAAGKASQPLPTVVVVRAVRETVVVETDVPGRLAASRKAEVRARVEGIVEAQRYREGSEVQAGQTLFALDDRPYRAALQAAEALVAQRRAELKRQEALVRQGFASPQTRDVARANLAAAEAQKTQAALNLEYAKVPAPIAGRAGRALVTEGALVGHGEATLLTTIEVLDPIHALITEPQAQWLARRTLAHLPPPRLVIDDAVVAMGEWIVSDAAVDPATGTVTSKVAFPNPDRRWLPGMFVKVRVPVAEREAVVVPQRALVSNSAGLFVWVVADGQARLQPVTLGGFSGENVVVASGLNGGEAVVVSGQARLQPPGGPVTVQE